jgi:hypothetical protein
MYGRCTTYKPGLSRVVRRADSFTRTLKFSVDGFGGGGPFERMRVLIPISNEALDLLQSGGIRGRVMQVKRVCVVAVGLWVSAVLTTARCFLHRECGADPASVDRAVAQDAAFGAT